MAALRDRRRKDAVARVGSSTGAQDQVNGATEVYFARPTMRLIINSVRSDNPPQRQV